MRRREETEEYWCGLSKILGGGWYATHWYDGNPSTYRDWAGGHRNNGRAKCVLFTLDGWKDELCDTEFYYVCKAPAGCKLASTCCNHRHRDGHGSIFLFTQPNPTHPSHTYVKCRRQYCRIHIFTCT